VRVGENVVEQLAVDLELELEAIDRYRSGIQLTLEHGDAGTREVLEHLLVGEESHADWIEAQQQLVADIGAERYMQSQMHS
jgi:bacterioferritin